MLHRTFRAVLGGVLVTLCAAGGALGQVGIASVLVDNPGNLANTDGFGATPLSYAIGQVEVTNEQYARFLNAVAANADPGGLWDVLMGGDPRGGISRVGAGAPYHYVSRAHMDDKPVNFVTWVDAARFCNWMHNGQPFADQGPGVTETGAYAISGTAIVPRQPGAKWYLPSENEWYKAAYHDPINPGADALGTPDYWLYPTKSDVTPTMAAAGPTGVITNPGANVADYNFAAIWNGQTGNVTTIGSAASVSFYGTYDQGGNVDELLEPVGPTGGVLLRGGGWDSVATRLRSTSRLGSPLTSYGSAIGFRVAADFAKAVTFSIAPGTAGVASPPGNAVFANPDPGDLYFSVAQAKRDTLNKGNALNVDGQLSIGLLPGDDIDALQGPIHRLPRGHYVFRPRFIFSVRGGSQGEPSTPVNMDFPFNGGDLFLTTPPGHMLVLPERVLGLNTTNPIDDVNALSLEPMSPFAAGSRIWFSLRNGSPTLLTRGWSGADILTAVVGSPGSLAVSIPAGNLGLQFPDDVDALTMVEGLDADGDGLFIGPNDVNPWTYFSVTPGSMGLPGSAVAAQASGNGAAADIFESLGAGNNNVVFDNVAHLRLLSTDDIDALEVPDIECNNPPFADFPPDLPPFGGGPPPPLPPKDPSTKTALCYTIAVCDTPFPQDWWGSIKLEYLDCTVIPPVMHQITKRICGKGGSKAAAIANLLGDIDCPGNPGKKFFQWPIVTQIPPPLDSLPPNDPKVVAWKKLWLDPCIACDPQANRIIGQVDVWVDPTCAPNVKICPLEISLTNYTISIVKATPAPSTTCDRRLVALYIPQEEWTPTGTGTFEMVFGTGDPSLPNNFLAFATVNPSTSPAALFQSLALQIRNAGGVAGVHLPTPSDPRFGLLVERTPVDPPPMPGVVGGPIMIEAGSLVRGTTLTYSTTVLTTPLDCNGNHIPDTLDIETGFSMDVNGDHIPDSCLLACLCPADFDCSGTLAVADIFAFINGWFAGVPQADFDHMNGVAVADIFAFLNAWFAGC